MLADSHAHTMYSFDGGSAARADTICEEYITKGFSLAALTDHYDVDYIEDGLYSPYRVDEARREYEAACEKYAGRFELIWGIELGQAPFVRTRRGAFSLRTASSSSSDRSTTSICARISII